MAGSRGFLLVLVLATVTCIVLIQTSLDGWIRRGSLNFYQLAMINTTNDKPDKNIVPSQTDSPSTTSTSPILSSTTQPKLHAPGQRRLTNRLKPSNGSSWIKSPTVLPSRSVEAKVRVRDLSVGKSLNFMKPPLVIEQQAKIQQILKRKDAMQRRVKGDPMKDIKAMPTVNPAKVNRIFLITYFRSGSSFLGELLQQNWKTFYQFEPLHYMTYGSRISGLNRTEEALDLFNSIYHCNFSGLDNYFEWVRKSQNQFLFTRSLFLWYMCRTNPRVCFSPEFVSAVCQRTLVQVVKTTRLDMRQLQMFLDKNPDLNIKVVFLTRDPRGIISSRWTLLDWCKETDCSDPSVICNEMRDDISVFEELRGKEPSKFIRVRYEDLALNPEIEAKKLLQFLNLPYSQSVRRFLKSHTTARKTDNLDPYSTRRNSSSMAFSWKKRFDFEKVQTIQNSCSDVINYLNYSMIMSPSELDNSKYKVYTNISLKSENSTGEASVFMSTQNQSKYAFNNVIKNRSRDFPAAVTLSKDRQDDTVLQQQATFSFANFTQKGNFTVIKYVDAVPNSNNFQSNYIQIPPDIHR